ncbi:glycerophosphodiester phosphodiesterase family protein [Enterococcus cecorum]|uniref:glycerophosphodiester phosphodiesterase family protein n=1 Tax=Enterococcus cecorum TaxID=44008 RepID=UPI0022CFB1B4|nr:glycerophosphodiester phosphodiesterase family protein [Enterococcus cecorum]MDZ5440729.1 glycerophosphodiester phosphodiesterase family protein [Enterococcus cecorum]MDZ5497743.1 glycerophosphodiester phosphodiesterase family protein [Enterococcus cecorum]MDZ5499877.1 glycerophosphodiester phosphodiesterase family protein [Enterococcus cecorum]MDZ5562693.1 glycerophosphodiester phosphodiesterase family protein [Enterococcus cecorum]MDZ5600131.1 glycerophosphodiester phosphodiesterase famil
METLQELRKKGILVAAHRGTNGGNIVQNTTLAYLNALRHGADMIEVDVIRSTDGDFFAFHNGQEDIVFGDKSDILQMSTQEILTKPVRNTSGEYISQRIEKLDYIFGELKDKCWINIDRSWFYWDTFLDYLSNVKIKNQFLLKSPVEKVYLDQLSQSKLDIKYMPIVKNLEELALVMQYDDLDIAAVELIIESLDSDLLSTDVFSMLKEKGVLLWINALTLNDEIILSAGYDDNKSIIKGPEYGWGKLVDLGFDIIQTDWPLLLKEFLKNK